MPGGIMGGGGGASTDAAGMNSQEQMMVKTVLCTIPVYLTAARSNQR